MVKNPGYGYVQKSFFFKSVENLSVSTSTCQTKLKKILIKQKRVIQIIFHHVNEETCQRRSFQELIVLIYVK